jgi:RNA polymerase sigma-70 factor (ECF subfamily)
VPPVSENELVQRARAGDEDAFAELVTRHADQVFGALRRFGLDADEADEVAQAVFVRAWRGLARFESRAKLSTWLYRIAFNEAQRQLSRRGRRVADPAINPGDHDPDPDPVAGLAEDELRGPDAQALERELDEMLERALAQLPPEWRAAVVLRDLEGLSTAEAAEVIGIREAAFKSRLHRGRMRLRELLEPYLGSIVR